ncbi:MAG: cytochrome c3 family protein [Bacteroidales bacterium]|nr:cytochrome c3 family protein [Bacteroidales bacterium]
MSLPRSSKEKSARINWGYFNQSAPTTRVRGWLWILVALGITIPLTALAVRAALTGHRPESLDVAASRGTLANPHAGLDAQCEACHQPFSRIQGGDWVRDLGLPFSIGSRPDPHTDGAKWQNTKCESCHAGSPHHPRMNANSPFAVGCAGCHRDHLGRDFDLTQMSDSRCVSCHQALPAHSIDPSGTQVATRITSFAQDHPEFRQLGDAPAEKTQRRLKFSHAVHMMPGMGVGSGYKLSDIVDPAQRNRYAALLGKSNPDAVIQLTCAACHQLDASRTDGMAAGTAPTPEEAFTQRTRPLLGNLPDEPLLPTRAAGQHFLPINFETHCVACHPLTFDESEGLRQRSVPHRAQPDQIERYLREVYSARYIADQLKSPVEPNRGTGRLDPLPADLDAAGKKLARERIAQQVTTAMETLFRGNKTCLECHYTTASATQTGEAAALPQAIVPPNIPTVHQPRARFDHASHRGMNCQSCHPANYAGDSGGYRTPDAEREAARKYADPQDAFRQYQHPPDLPAIATCRQCHTPARVENGVTVAGVRYSCTDCHIYHHADRRLQGPGSPRNLPPAGQMDLKKMILGDR